MNARGSSKLDQEIDRMGGPQAVLEEIDVERRPAWVERMKGWRAPSDAPYMPPPVEWVWEPIIPRGKVGPVVSEGGAGKTTMFLSLFVCGAAGRDFLGKKVQRGSYVVISNDDSQADLDAALEMVIQAQKLAPQERAAARSGVRVFSLQADPGAKAFSAFVGGMPMPTELPEHIIEALCDVPDLQLVFLDTLRQTAGGATNDEQVVRIAIDGANRIATRLGCAVVFAHHTGKSNYRDGVDDMYCGSGSAAIADNSRFVLLLQRATWSDIEAKMRRTDRETGQPWVLLSTRGNIRMKAAAPIFLHRDEYFFGPIAGETLTREQVLDARDRSILMAVRRGAQSKTAIAKVVGGKRANVLHAIDDLETRGYLLNSSPTGSLSNPLFVLTGEGGRYLEVTE